MDVKLVRGEVPAGGINPKELNEDSYVEYCKLYLIQRIYEIIPAISGTEYKHISTLINCINRDMFLSLNTETGRILLLNKIFVNQNFKISQ